MGHMLSKGPDTLPWRVRPAIEARDSSLDHTALLSKGTVESLPYDVTAIPRSSGLLSESELDLTESYDATALLELLAQGEVSSLNLLNAFRKRATIAQQCTNCITELLPEAIRDAAACDEHLARTGNPMGPLHGLPVSVKEQISISGHRTNAAFVAWVDNVSTEDAHIVKSLKALGAVVFARTNQPQSLLQLETNNNIYGATVHPKNRGLTAGGSTGGEAALMAMYGTPLGIGGDIGGSIRYPAAINGIYGFMPTPGRISGSGVVVPSPGCDSILGTLGPFTRSLRDLEMFCDAYSSARPWIYDPSLVPTDILNPSLGRQLDADRPLRIGIMHSDDVVNPLPPVRHVINKVRDRLAQNNTSKIEIKSFKALDHDRAWTLIAANYLEDGGADIRRVCDEGGEPVLPLTEWVIAQTKTAVEAVSSDQGTRKAARDAFREEYAKHWDAAGVDVVIAPATPGTAPRLGTPSYWGYTAVWNLLQYPSVSFPAADAVNGWEGFDSAVEAYRPRNELERLAYRDYAPTISHGMPVGLLVVAPRLHESLLIKSMGIIEGLLRAE